jgi:tetratricopeptide (TPR) repeat protein
MKRLKPNAYRLQNYTSAQIIDDSRQHEPSKPEEPLDSHFKKEFDVCITLGITLFEQKRYEAAIKQYKQAERDLLLRKEKKWLTETEYYFLLNDIREKIQVCQDALKIAKQQQTKDAKQDALLVDSKHESSQENETSLNNYFTKRFNDFRKSGDALFEQKNYERAIEKYKQAEQILLLKKEPWLRWLGKSYYQLLSEEIKEAIKNCQNTPAVAKQEDSDSIKKTCNENYIANFQRGTQFVTQPQPDYAKAIAAFETARIAVLVLHQNGFINIENRWLAVQRIEANIKYCRERQDAKQLAAHSAAVPAATLAALPAKVGTSPVFTSPAATTVTVKNVASVPTEFVLDSTTRIKPTSS